jgi:hypothetical protein
MEKGRLINDTGRDNIATVCTLSRDITTYAHFCKLIELSICY